MSGLPLRIRIVACLAGATFALQADSPRRGTEILWDKFGVAHVYAKSTEDLFYCYGRAQAKSHGDLLLHLYGESRGRAAEYFGASHLELGIFRVITFGSEHGATQSQTHGETWIAAVEFSKPLKAKVLMTYGNSSQTGLSHQSDQLPLLARKELRTAWRTRADVMANLESTDKF